MSEKELIQAAQKGDNEAFEELYVKFNPCIQKVLFLKAKSYREREELTQQTWIKIYRALGGFQFNSSFKTWISKIATNTFLDYLASQKRWSSFEEMVENESLDLEQFLNEDSPAVLLQRTDDLKYLFETIKWLPEIHQKVLDFHVNKGLDYKTISKKMKTSMGTTQSRLFYGRKKLKEILKEEYA